MNSKIRYLNTYAIGFTFAALLGFVPAMAVDASNATSASGSGDSNTQLEELTVTARKRDETLMSVPVAVTVIGAADITRYDAADLISIGQLAPNLIITAAEANGGASFTLRGIGSTPEDAGIDSSVSVVLDGAPISRGRIITASMFDLAQVEVLEGPQALFFGKNASAGVVSLTSAGPTNTFQGSVKSGFEFTTDERFVEAWAAGPITDAWRFRIAVRASESDGFIRNVAVAQPTPAAFGGPDIPLPGATSKTEGTTDDLAGRITVQYDAGGSLSGTLKAMEGRFLGNSTTGDSELICRPGVADQIYGISDPTGSCGSHPTFTASVGGLSPVIARTMPGAGDGQPYSFTDLFVGSVTLNYHLDDLTATSVTGFSDLNYSGVGNYDWTTFSQIASFQAERNRDVSEEIRISSDWKMPINFTAGAYYEHYKRVISNDTIFIYVGPDPSGKYYDVGKSSPAIGDSISGFAQARWNVFNSLELDAGARYTHETKNTAVGNDYVNPIIGAALGLKPAGDILSGTYHGDNTSPEVTLNWRPNSDQTLYAAYKVGYKSGGFADPGTVSTSFTNISTISFQPEVAKGEEIGYKAQLFDRRLRFELTAYKYHYSNLQVVSYEAATNSFQVKNSGAATTKGVETSMQWRVLSPFTLRATLAYDKAVYAGFLNAQCGAVQPNEPLANVPGTCHDGLQDLSGSPTILAPVWVGSIGGTYDLPISAGLRIGIDADANYSGGYYTEATEDPFLYQHAYWLVNAGIRLHPDDGDKWELAVFGKNLGDHAYFQLAGQQPGGNPGAYFVLDALPRTVQVQATYRF